MNTKTFFCTLALAAGIVACGSVENENKTTSSVATEEVVEQVETVADTVAVEPVIEESTTESSDSITSEEETTEPEVVAEEKE